MLDIEQSAKKRHSEFRGVRKRRQQPIPSGEAGGPLAASTRRNVGVSGLAIYSTFGGD